jgi:hypothetical protein
MDRLAFHLSADDLVCNSSNQLGITKQGLRHRAMRRYPRASHRTWFVFTGSSRKALTGALEEAGLRGAIVTVEPVAELPRHPETNKLKRFMPLS